MTVMPFRLMANDDRAANSIRMNVSRPIDPPAVPAGVVDDHYVVGPDNPVITPSPRTKYGPNDYAETEADGRAHKKSRPWRHIHHLRVVIGDNYEIRTCRRNRDLR